MVLYERFANKTRSLSAPFGRSRVRRKRFSVGGPVGHALESEESSQREPLPRESLATLIQEALAEILISNPFRTSKQAQELLRFIVDRTLSGHSELLKERVIGIEVFGRRPDYDTNSDPIVRARVAEVRKRLALYYQIEHEKAVRISIPIGSFRAAFERIDRNRSQPPVAPSQGPEPKLVEPATSPIPQEVVELVVSPSSKRFSARRWSIIAASAAVILIGAIQHWLPSPEIRIFNQFWSPILDSHQTTLIYVGGNAVYQLSPSFLAAYYRDHPRSNTEQMGYESYIPLPPGTKIDTRDLYPAKDTFVTIGDVAAITKIESLLVRRDRQFSIRYGGDVAYGDLRERPTILIGAHNNPWTLSVTENLRYVFDGPSGIVDRSGPRKRWSASAGFTEDYAIVSRVLNSKTGTTVIAAAGVGYAGTEAAAEFLTNPQSISALVKSLPKGWEKRNIQVVLHTSVTNQLPGAPEVVATYCW